ncbi:MAG: sialidase family protein [Planctomycetota bacterium]
MGRHLDFIMCPLRETGPGNLRNSEGAIIELRDGRLLGAYTHFYADGSDWGAGDIMGKTSEDGGATWSAPFVIEPNSARCNVGRLALVRLKGLHDGYHREAPYLAHIYVELNNFYTNRMIFKTSIDEGKTWSSPVQINDTGTLGHICQRGDTALVLSTGRIVVPVYGMFGGMCASFMYYSDDGGETWLRSRGEVAVHFQESGRDFAYADFEEPAVVELRDGRLLCFGRTRLGQLYQSWSSDSGLTWSAAEPSGLASSYSPASLKTIPTTGDILCVWNQASAQEIADGLARMRMSCAVSRDDGKSWELFRNLESLDDRVRIEPERGATDTVGEMQAIQARLALQHKPTQKDYPDEVKKRYPRWQGYKHVDYPSTTFTSDGHVLVSYGVYGSVGKELPMGQKLVVRPIEWLYEK